MTIEVEIEAFSEADADEIVSDIFGAGELEAFDITVTSMTIVK